MKGSAIVTGGSRGIGASTALLLARAGFAVCVNHRDSAGEADDVVGAIRNAGGKACAVAADVAVDAEVKRLFAEAESKLGRIAVLVNNACYFGRAGRRMEDFDAEMGARVMLVNVVGAMSCAREAIHRMSTRRGGRGGRIVNVSSSAAQRGSPNDWIDYAASKAAIETFTKGTALEVAEEGIRINAVAAGLTQTDSHARAGMPDRVAKMSLKVPVGRAAKPEEIAETIVWLAADAPDFMTGAVVPVTGGF